MADHVDIKGEALLVGEHVAFCKAGTSKGMTLGWVRRVLPKTVEVEFQEWCPRRKTMVKQYVFRAPSDVCRISPRDGTEEALSYE